MSVNLAPQFEHLAGQIADLQERVAVAEPKHVSELVTLLVKQAPEQVAEMLRLTDPACFDRLLTSRSGLETASR
jgi:hypothetical protein